MPGTVTHFWIFQRAMFDEDSGFTQHYLQKLGSSKATSPGGKFVHGFLESLKKDYGNFISWESLKNTHTVAKNPKNNRKKIEKAKKEAKKAKEEARKATEKSEKIQKSGASGKDKEKARKDAEDKKKNANLKEKEFQKIKEQCDRPGVLAGMGYIGSTGPDLFSVPPTIKKEHGKLETNKLSALAHYNKTGSLVIHNLAKLKKEIRKDNLSEDAKQELQYKLAYWLGHIAHLAADIVTHPYVNSRAGALQMLEKIFCNNESHPGFGIVKPWKTHNIVEQYQDAFVKHVLFKKEKRKDDWEHINFPLAAACYLRSDGKNEFIGKDTDDFYGQNYGEKQKYSKNGSKYEYCRVWFFVDDKIRSHMSFRNYLVNVIPHKSHREEKELMDLTVGKEAFGKHIEASVKLARGMMAEALDYLVSSDTMKENLNDEVYAAKGKGVKLLQLNWNIDTGHGFEFEETPIEEVKTPSGPYLKLGCLHVHTYPRGQEDGAVVRDRRKGSEERAVGRGVGNVLDAKTPRWCVEIAPQVLVRRKYDEEGTISYPAGDGPQDYVSGLEVYVVPADAGDAEKAGASTRTLVNQGKSGDPKVERLYWWDDPMQSNRRATTRDADTGSASLPCRPILALGMSPAQKAAEDEEEVNHGSENWNDLLNRIVVLTPKRDGVWNIGKSSGRFKRESVEGTVEYPSEQVFLKFHVFLESMGANLHCDDSASITSLEKVPLEARIHHLSVELGTEDGRWKLKNAYLDGDRMLVVKAK